MPSHGQLSSSDLPFHLTNGTEGLKHIKFRATEQCPANIRTDKATKKLFAIEFLRLPKDRENCNEGVLICYPALLQRSGTYLDTFVNFKVKRTFTMGSKEGNPITRECAKLMTKNGNENGKIQWRGIKLPAHSANANGG
ncbi:hypothetical protein niasHT_002228 [Heterodera trifolii]|uniref:Uncharacterized protein n=1 Tax=Heterodera trifolii TaxID=157864 RepID=A0ABD2LTY6_9BILA